MVICLERDADLHMAQLMPLPLTVSCFSKIQIGFTFLVSAHPGSPGKRAVKRVCVCVIHACCKYKRKVHTCTHAHKHARAHARMHAHTHSFNGTTQVSRYQEGKTNLDFTEARDSEWQWHLLGHMQVCTSLRRQTTTPTPHHSVFYRPDALPAAQPTVSKH